MSNSDREHAQEELRKQLNQANADFEEFVSRAAHNLRESLRDVTSYSQLMSEKYAGRLDPEADLYLARIQAGAAGMQSLLADVVNYWSTGDSQRQSSRVDMEAALGQALLCADRQITERGAVVSHDPLPAVAGDFELMTKVLRRLIENAIQYCVAPSPRVHLSCKRMGSDWVFSVQDNGPGIESAFRERIFEVFRRLHGKEYPGNGLGLAFCKKSIEGNGGRIWVESTPGAGSTFYFTAPADE
jgi:light-regulated signal transduction histidine kinase (bacteriophytochrome)